LGSDKILNLMLAEYIQIEHEKTLLERAVCLFSRCGYRGGIPDDRSEVAATSKIQGVQMKPHILRR
jgi:hypothetical protein